MGYGPTAIGLSYVPQTIAFLVGGYGCRAALQKWQGQQLLPRLLVIFAVSVTATLDGGHGCGRLNYCADDSLLRDGDCQWRDLPDSCRQGAEAVPQATGRAAALQNTLQLGLCFLTSLLVSALIATPLLTTTSVMLVSIVLAGLGYFMQRQSACLTTESSHA